MSLADKIVNQNADQRSIGQIIAEESEDLRDGWIVETNDTPKGKPEDKNKPEQPEEWHATWETWFFEDDDEADRVEKEYASRGESFEMKPRPFIDILEVLKQNRPNHEEWVDYRFKNVKTGMIICAWLLK